MIGRLIALFLNLFTGRNWHTWVGHGLQGVLFGALLTFISWSVALSFVLGAFLHRELSDFVTPVYLGRLTWAESWQKVKEDGLMDLAMPIVGAGVGILLNLLLL